MLPGSARPRLCVRARSPCAPLCAPAARARVRRWNEAADLIVKGMDGAISAKTVTYDFHRMMEGATKLKCSQFGDAIIKHM